LTNYLAESQAQTCCFVSGQARSACALVNKATKHLPHAAQAIEMNGFHSAAPSMSHPVAKAYEQKLQSLLGKKKTANRAIKKFDTVKMGLR